MWGGGIGNVGIIVLQRYSPGEVSKNSAAQFIYEEIRPNQFYAIRPIGVIRQWHFSTRQSKSLTADLA